MATYNETVTDGVLQYDVPLGNKGAGVETLLMSLTLSEGILVTYPLTVTDALTIADTITADLIAQILEHIDLAEVLTSKATFGVTADDIVQVATLAALSWSSSILESIDLADTDEAILHKLVLLREQMDLLDTTATQAVVNTALAVALSLHEDVRQIDIIAENMSMDDTFIDTLKIALSIVDIINALDTADDSVTFFITVLDDGALNDTIDQQVSLVGALSDGLLLSTRFVLSGEVYSGWVMNPENYAISTYDNYEFNSMALYQGSNLMAGSAGLYSLGGTTDESSYIQARITTAVMTWGTSSFKTVPEVLLGVNNSGTVILKVSVDGDDSSYYELIPASVGLSTQQIKTGKGLYGRYWQFSLITKENSTLDLDTFEFLPLLFGRKVGK